MKDYKKKDIVFLCTVAGYLMRQSKLDWDNPLLNLQKNKLLEEVLKTTDLMKALSEENEFAKLHKNIKALLLPGLPETKCCKSIQN